MGTRDSHPRNDERTGIPSSAPASARPTTSGTPLPGTPNASLRADLKSATDQAEQTAEGVTDQAQQVAGELATQAQQKATEVIGMAQQQLQTQLDSQKAVMAQGLGSVAEAFRQTGQQLRQRDTGPLPVAQYADMAASKIDQAAHYLQEKDLGEVVSDIERFARREPTLFLGGAFLLGVLGARFLKSSSPAMPLAQRPAAYGYDYRRQGMMPQSRPGMHTGPAPRPGMQGSAGMYSTPAPRPGMQGSQGMPNTPARPGMQGSQGMQTTPARPGMQGSQGMHSSSMPSAHTSGGQSSQSPSGTSQSGERPDANPRPR